MVNGWVKFSGLDAFWAADTKSNDLAPLLHSPQSLSPSVAFGSTASTIPQGQGNEDEWTKGNPLRLLIIMAHRLQGEGLRGADDRPLDISSLC